MKNIAILLLTFFLASAALADDPANQAWVAGDVETAGRLYAERLAASPADWQAAHRLGLIREWAGKHDEAIAFFDQAIKANPEDIEALLDRARAIAGKGDLKGAAAALEPLLAKEPANLPALRARAQFLSWAGDFDRSVDAYGRILELTPDDRATALQRARVLSWASKLDASEEVYRKVLAGAPNDPEAIAGLAQVLSWEGKLAESESWYRKLLAMNPKDADAKLGLARTAAWQGHLLEAEQRWREILDADPTSSAALIGLSATLRWQGRQAAALELAQRAVTLSPKDAEARTEYQWARLASRPQLAPSFVAESDSDHNRILTSAISATVAVLPRLQLRADAYNRDAELRDASGASLTSRGATLTVSRFFEPGWVVAAGGGQTWIEGGERFGVWRASVSSPTRNAVSATLSYGHSAFDATTLLMQRLVEMDDAQLSVQITPAAGWKLSIALGTTLFHGRVSGLDNRRVNEGLVVTRRAGKHFTLGVSGRSFTFDKHLDDGYFNPELYWLAEALARYNLDLGAWNVNLEVAGGIQQIDRGGEDRGTFRGAAGITYQVAPGRTIGINAAYSNSGLSRLSAGSGSYRYTAIGAAARWSF